MMKYQQSGFYNLLSTFGNAFIDFHGVAWLDPERILIRHILHKYYDGRGDVPPPVEPVRGVPQHQVQIVSLGPGVVVQA